VTAKPVKQTVNPPRTMLLLSLLLIQKKGPGDLPTKEISEMMNKDINEVNGLSIVI